MRTCTSIAFGAAVFIMAGCVASPPTAVAPEPAGSAAPAGWPAVLWGRGPVELSALAFVGRDLVVAGRSQAGVRVGRHDAIAAAGPFVIALDDEGAARWVHAPKVEGNATINAVSVTRGGAVLFVGSFQGSIGDGGSELTSADLDCVVGRVEPDGAAWLKAIGGPGIQTCDRLEAGQGDSVRVVGSYDTAFAGLPTPQGGSDVMVLALDPGTGEVKGALGFGGGGDDLGRDLAIDGEGGVVVVGTFGGTVDGATEPVSPRAAALELAPSLSLQPVGDRDGFVVHFDAQGAATWATAVAGPGLDLVERVVPFADGWIVAGAQAPAAPAPTEGADTTADVPSLQGFVMRVEAAGEIAWTFADPSLVTVRSLEVTRDRIIAVGEHRDGLDLGEGSWRVAGDTGITLAVLAADGTVAGAYGCDGTGPDRGSALATTPDGRIALGGDTTPGGGCATILGRDTAGFVKPMVLDADAQLRALVAAP